MPQPKFPYKFYFTQRKLILMMYRIWTLVRFIYLGTCVSAPFVLFGYFSFGIPGAVFGLASVVIGLTTIALNLEKIVSRAHHAHSLIPPGITRSLELASQGLCSQLPIIRVFEDPTPTALVVRSLGKPGTLLLSRGLIVLLNEKELRNVIQVGILRLQTPGIIFCSFCSTFSMCLLAIAPKPWVKLLFMTKKPTLTQEGPFNPFSTLVFLILYPIAQLLQKWGSEASKKRPFAAVQKLEQAILFWGHRHKPGLFPLSLIDLNGSH